MQELNKAISVLSGMPAGQRGARARAAEKLGNKRIYVTQLYKRGFGVAIAYRLWNETGRAVDLGRLVEEGEMIMEKAA